MYYAVYTHTETAAATGILDPTVSDYHRGEVHPERAPMAAQGTDNSMRWARGYTA